MSEGLQFLLESFSDRSPSVRPRPDGSVLLEMDDADERVCRVVGSQDLSSASAADQFIRRMEREMKLQKGELRWHTRDDASIVCDLPTYTGDAIYLRAAQTLVARRKIR